MRDRTTISPAACRVLTAIARLRVALGCCPSQQELSEALGFAAKGEAITCHLRRLEAKGCIRRAPGLARTVRLAPPCFIALDGTVTPLAEVPLGGEGRC